MKEEVSEANDSFNVVKLETCETCKFWKGAAVVINRCKRRSPVIPGDSHLSAEWPSTHRDDWCGEFES